MTETSDLHHPSEPTSGRIDDGRDVHYGRVYGPLRDGQVINIAALGEILIEVDEGNLSLESVSLESLQESWEKVKEGFTAHCAELGIALDPFEVYKFYLIQRKVRRVLGPPFLNDEARKLRLTESNVVKLSDTKGFAMCAEYAILAALIAQKIGETVHLIIGSAVDPHDEDQWREAHTYVWVDRLSAVFDCVLPSSDNEYPAIMMPLRPATLET